MARGGAAAATLAGIMLMGRRLGSVRYGELVLLLTIMKVAAELIGPAIDTTMVRFIAKLGPAQPDGSLRYARIALHAKLVLGVLCIAAGATAAPWIHGLFLDGAGADPVPAYAVTLALAGAAATMLMAYAQAYFQAKQQFTRFAGVELFVSLSRLALIAGVVLLARSAQWTDSTVIVLFLASYAAAVLLVGGSAWTLLPSHLLGRAPAGVRPQPEDAVGADMFHFTKWVFAACCFTSLAHRADIFLVNAFGQPPREVGDYSGAVQLVLLGDLVILTLFNVLLPKTSNLKTPDEMAAFLKGFRLPAIAAMLAAAPLVVLSGPIARVVLGSGYAATGALLGILLVGAVFSLGCAPAGTVLYGMGRPYAVAALEGIKLAAIVAAGCFVIPRHGVFGMAWTLAVVKSTIGVATVVVAHASIAGMRASEETAT